MPRGAAILQERKNKANPISEQTATPVLRYGRRTK
jgi:hypothetical protein